MFDGKFKYNHPLDIGYLFSSKEKLNAFFAFFIEECMDTLIKFGTGNLKMLPIVENIIESSGAVFYCVDYNFFVQCIGRYIKKNNLGYAEKFVNDFKIIHKGKDTNRDNGLHLTHCILERKWRCIYVNSVGNMQVKYLRYASNIIFKNDKIAVEFAAIPFSRITLLELIDDAELFRSFYAISMNDEVKQVAFGQSECAKFWEKNSDNFRKIIYLSRILQ